jgi:hypothetical protein
LYYHYIRIINMTEHINYQSQQPKKGWRIEGNLFDDTTERIPDNTPNLELARRALRGMQPPTGRANKPANAEQFLAQQAAQAADEERAYQSGKPRPASGSVRQQVRSGRPTPSPAQIAADEEYFRRRNGTVEE